MSRGYGRAQHAVLAFLRERPGERVDANDIAAACGVDPSNMGRTLARLLADDHVCMAYRWTQGAYRRRRPPGVAGEFTLSERGYAVLQVWISDDGS